MKVTKAVIPAAGLGTRMLPISKSVPKEMLPIVDKPAIQYLVEEAVASGITDISSSRGGTRKRLKTISTTRSNTTSGWKRAARPSSLRS